MNTPNIGGFLTGIKEIGASTIGLIPNNQEKKRLKKAEKNKVIALEVYRELHFWYGYLQC
jgi:hypothetical protein